MYPYQLQQLYPYQGMQGANQFLQPSMLQKQEVVRVKGRNGAEAFQLAPNSSALLLDESDPLVWLVQTDGAGYKTVTPYSIVPYQPEPQIDLSDLEGRISRLEGLLSEKSNIGNPKRNQGKSSNANGEH